MIQRSLGREKLMQSRSGFCDLTEEFHGHILSTRGQSSEISCREHKHVRHATGEIQNKYVRFRDGRISTHANPAYTSPCGVTNWNIFFIVVHALADLSDFGLLGSKVPKMCDSLLRTPINRRAKFYATYFIIGGKIRNRTKNKQKTVNDKTIYPYLAYRRVTGICRTEM